MSKEFQISIASATASRRALLAGGSASLLAVLAACGSGSSTSEGDAASSSAGDAASSSAGGSGSPSAGGDSPSAAAPTTVPAQLDEDYGSGQADDVFPRTVRHYQGETTIDAAPTRVVIISTGQADAMLTLGMCPIGSTAASGTDAPIPQYLQDAYPDQAGAIAAVTHVGSRTQPDIEAIAALTPDLILTNISGKDDPETLYRNLTAIAPTVSTRGTGQYWKVDFLLLADALGKREAAQSRLDSFVEDAKTRGSAIEAATTVSLLRKNGDKLRIFGPVSFSGSVVADMGLSRPTTQQFTDGVSQELSAETLDQADGDWLFYGVQGGDETELTSQTLWESLSAVSAGHAVEVDDDPFFLNAGPTAARTVLDKIASTLSA